MKKDPSETGLFSFISFYNVDPFRIYERLFNAFQC